MSKAVITKTVSGRGFGYFHFNDLNHLPCVLQDSSLGSEPAIRFGTTADTMHLSQKMVQQLLPYLTQFAQTGDYLCSMDLEDVEESEESEESDESEESER